MTASSTAHPSAREVFERQLGRAMAGDRAGQAEFFAADAVFEYPFAPPGVPERFVGRDEILGMSKALDRAARDSGIRIDRENSRLVVHETTDPEVIVAEIDTRVEQADGRDPRRTRLIQVVRVSEGQIRSVRDYFAGETATFVQSVFGGSDTRT